MSLNLFPTPHLIAHSILENITPYIIMSEVSGATLEKIWTELSSTELHTIAREIGILTAQLHHMSHDELAAVEAQFGGKDQLIKEMQTERVEEIEIINKFSARHKDELLEFLYSEALDFLDAPSVLTHSDLSHAHIYIARASDQARVSGWIDWAEAMLGVPEWDISFHWFWTFSQDHPTMRACLDTYYQDIPRPEQFARRCFATHFYTYSMGGVWRYFNEAADDSQSIVQAMITSLFPADVFGASD